MSIPPNEPTEEELRAAYEAELAKIRVEHVLLEQVVTLVNLGMRRTGLAPGTETERDAAQVQLAIEAIRALMPLVDAIAPEQANPIRQALSQLQLAYVRIGGGPEGAVAAPGATAAPGGAPASGDPFSGAGAASAGSPASPSGPAAPGSSPDSPGEGPGPAQRSGRLWIPGQ